MQYNNINMVALLCREVQCKLLPFPQCQVTTSQCTGTGTNQCQVSKQGCKDVNEGNHFKPQHFTSLLAFACCVFDCCPPCSCSKQTFLQRNKFYKSCKGKSHLLKSRLSMMSSKSGYQRAHFVEHGEQCSVWKYFSAEVCRQAFRGGFGFSLVGSQQSSTSSP